MNAVIDIQQLVPAWQSLQLVAPVAHIDSETGYAQATALLNSLLDVVRDNAQHPLYSLVSVVGDLIEAYEIDHDPLG
jgi:HTH-type transcriptional regulator/antitoxin HigA